MRTFLAVLSLVSLFSGVSSEAATWRLRGFVYEETRPVWLTIQDGRIVCRDLEKNGVTPKPKKCLPDVELQPVATELRTEAILSPGFIDMHNHVEFNSLPLWTEARGQFKNRFEWRELGSYQNGPHKFFMRLMREDADFTCASLRWSELQALTGGATAIQGLGRKTNDACAREFGIRNLEISQTMESEGTISGTFEIFSPDLVEDVFDSSIEPLLPSKSYQRATEVLLQKSKISDWLTRFKEEPHTLENGLRLTLGVEVESALQELSEPLNMTTVGPFVEAFLTANKDVYGLDEAAVQAHRDRVLAWMVEKKIGGVSYVEISPEAPNVAALALKFLAPDRFDRATRNFDAVLHIPRPVRDYFVEFEWGVLKSVRSRLDAEGMNAYLTHLGEGRRDDTYTAKEFKYAATTGLIRPNFVAIHGVSFSQNDFKTMKKAKSSMVWSAFSNLLLYGETLNVKALVKSGVRFALGSDWTISGSKTLLDEMKVAAAAARAQGVDLDAETLWDAVSFTAADILGLGESFGSLDLGAVADITVFTQSSEDKAKSVLAANQKDVELVVVAGEPVYGDMAKLEKLATELGDALAPEAVTLDAQKCQGPVKGFRLLSAADPQKRYSYQELKTTLEAKFAEASVKYKTQFQKEGLTLSPLFSCEDEAYQQALESAL